MQYEIFSDSGCDLTQEMLEQYDIHQVYFYVSFDEHKYMKEKLDIDTTTYYHRMIDEAAFPKTSLPSVQDYIDAFKSTLDEGKNIICICMSGKLSGSSASARTAKDILLETYPDAKIAVFNSNLCSVAEGLYALEAGRMRKNGLSFKEAVRNLERIQSTGRICFTVKNLEHLKRGGRIGKMAYIAGSALGIKPLIVMKEGEIFSAGIARNKKKALKKLLEIGRDYFEKAHENPNDYCFSVGTGIEFKEGEELAAAVKQTFWLNDDVQLYQIGATVATHTGPYPLGYAFIKKYDA